MKSAKTAGGIIKFVNSEEYTAKWVLNRPYHSMFTKAIKKHTTARYFKVHVKCQKDERCYFIIFS